MSILLTMTMMTPIGCDQARPTYMGEVMTRILGYALDPGLKAQV
jgi:hypothetical protein